MCFHAQLQTKKPFFEKYYGFDSSLPALLDDQFLDLESQYQPFYIASGFDHPEVLLVDQNFKLSYKSWGLIPHWVANDEQAYELSNKTINARAETCLEKPSFKEAMQNGRSVILMDAYYEHHHSGNGVYPYRFFRPDGHQVAVACAADSCAYQDTNKHSFSILTTQGNEKAKLVHNNPKKKEPRMPLILESAEDVASYLFHGNEKDVLNSLSQKARQCELKAQSVARFIGNIKEKNNPEALLHIQHPELGFFMPSEL